MFPTVVGLRYVMPINKRTFDLIWSAVVQMWNCPQHVCYMTSQYLSYWGVRTVMQIFILIWFLQTKNTRSSSSYETAPVSQFQLRAFCSFWVIAGRKIALSVTHPPMHPITSLWQHPNLSAADVITTYNTTAQTTHSKQNNLYDTDALITSHIKYQHQTESNFKWTALSPRRAWRWPLVRWGFL